MKLYFNVVLINSAIINDWYVSSLNGLPVDRFSCPDPSQK
jgi:hypothetical protein